MATDEATFLLGRGVRAKGLVQSAQHNGKIAVVIALAHRETGRFGVRFIQDGVEVRMKPCNMEIITGDELFQAELLKERLEFQQFVSDHPFPSLEVCLYILNECTSRDLELFGSCSEFPYASHMSSEVYAISRSIYQTMFFMDDQYASIKAAGRRLNALGGMSAMQAVYHLLNATHNMFLCLNSPWNGIGDWLA
jgi:hypothetical protein